MPTMRSSTARVCTSFSKMRLSSSGSRFFERRTRRLRLGLGRSCHIGSRSQLEKNSVRARLKSAVRSIFDQCPQWGYTDSWALSKSHQGQRGLDRDHLVLASLDDQCPVRHLADLVFRRTHRVDPPLAGRREHRRERLLESGLGTSAVAHLASSSFTSEREYANKSSTLRMFSNEGVSPHLVEPLGDREGHAHAAHQHELVDPVGVLGRHPQCDRAAEAVADQARFLDPERIHQADHLIRPRLQAVFDVVRPLRVAETDHVGSDHPELLREGGNDQTPVGIRGDTRSRAVDQHDRRPPEPPSR